MIGKKLKQSIVCDMIIGENNCVAGCAPYSEKKKTGDAYEEALSSGRIKNSRILVPEGYAGSLAEDGGFAAFLRNYPLKEDTFSEGSLRHLEY